MLFLVAAFLLLLSALLEVANRSLLTQQVSRWKGLGWQYLACLMAPLMILRLIFGFMRRGRGKTTTDADASSDHSEEVNDASSDVGSQEELHEGQPREDDASSDDSIDAFLLRELSQAPGAAELVERTEDSVLPRPPKCNFSELIDGNVPDWIKLSVLRQLSEAVFRLHKAGYVHTGIGCHSVLWEEENGKVTTMLTESGSSRRYDKEATPFLPAGFCCADCMTLVRPYPKLVQELLHPHTDIEAVGKLVDAVHRGMERKSRVLRMWVESSQGELGVIGDLGDLVKTINNILKMTNVVAIAMR